MFTFRIFKDIKEFKSKLVSFLLFKMRFFKYKDMKTTYLKEILFLTLSPKLHVYKFDCIFAVFLIILYLKLTYYQYNKSGLSGIPSIVNIHVSI